VVKKSQENAKKILAENEALAKEEIDLIVKIKKEYDDMSEVEKQAKKKEESKKTVAASRVDAALAKKDAETIIGRPLTTATVKEPYEKEPPKLGKITTGPKTSQGLANAMKSIPSAKK
jgi:hypothetical protein